MYRNIFAVLALLLVVSACFHPTSKDDELGGIVNPDPDPTPTPDAQPVFNKDNYFRLKPNSGDAFEKSLKTYLTSATSENYYYRNSGGAEFNTSGGSVTASPAPATGDTGSSATSGSANVSGTNLIEQGVDEADLIKSDGQFLYVARNSGMYRYGNPGILGIAGAASLPASATVVAGFPSAPVTDSEPARVLIYALNSTATPEATPLGSIETPADTTRIHGLYLTDNVSSSTKQLVVVSSAVLNNTTIYRELTRVALYDLSAEAVPTLAWTLDIDGSSVATRLLNNKLLLITRQYLDVYQLIAPYVVADAKAEMSQAIQKITVKDVLPVTSLNNEPVNLVDAADCIVPVSTNEQSYFDNGLTTLFTIPLNAPQTTDALCTLESSGEIYVSPKAMYMTKNDYVTGVGEGTLIHKFALNDSGLAYRASGRIAGTIGWRNNAFRMSEHQDYFRVVTSISAPYNDTIGAPFWRGFDQTHHLFILKEDKTAVGQLTVVSQLPNDTQPAALGKPGELLYGVRFNGNYGYAVTFKKTDPLYVLNLVNPEAPFIEGQLELPGYSDYLHPVNENVLIGIGKDAVEENGVAYYQGLKVGVFDIADKTNPKVVQEAVIGKRGTDSIALNDHHAFTYLTQADGVTRFAFPVTIHDGEPAYFNNNSASTYYNWQSSGLQLFELSESNGIYTLNNSGVLTVATANAGSTKEFYFEEPRALLVDDAVFMADKGEVWASNWYTPSQVLTTVAKEEVTYTGTLLKILGSTETQYIVLYDDTGLYAQLEYPSTILDEFVAANSAVGKVVTVKGILTSVPGVAPRKIKLTSITLVP